MITYGQAVSTDENRIWCANCETDLTHLKAELTDPTRMNTIYNVGGITKLANGNGDVLHVCAK